MMTHLGKPSEKELEQSKQDETIAEEEVEA